MIKLLICGYFLTILMDQTTSMDKDFDQPMLNSSKMNVYFEKESDTSSLLLYFNIHGLQLIYCT